MTLVSDVAHAVETALATQSEWGESGLRPGQYRSDLVADHAALGVLERAGVGVLSEESGLRRADHPLLVVVDPLDGSTNASMGLAWYATSVCAVDQHGPLAAIVVNLATGTRYEATRGGGARRDGRSISPSGCGSLSSAIVGLSGLPLHHYGWRQYRALGAAALDLCAVADGTLDGFVDCSDDAHGVWDYLGGWLVCREAGVRVIDAFDRELVVKDPALRRTPIAAGSEPLLDALIAARRGPTP